MPRFDIRRPDLAVAALVEAGGQPCTHRRRRLPTMRCEETTCAAGQVMVLFTEPLLAHAMAVDGLGGGVLMAFVPMEGAPEQKGHPGNLCLGGVCLQ